METSRVTTKGQVTIPQKIRERFDIHAGDVLAFVSAEDGTLRVQKLNLPDVEGAQGRLGTIAAAEGITEADVYLGPARPEQSNGRNDRRIARTLNNARSVGAGLVFARGQAARAPLQRLGTLVPTVDHPERRPGFRYGETSSPVGARST